MSLPIYNILHLVGALFLCIGFVALMSDKSAKKGMMFHGIGLVIVLISGFGQLAKLGMTAHMPTWAIVKAVIWLVLGFWPVLAKRKVLSRPMMVAFGFLFIAVAAYLGCSFYLGCPMPF